MLFAPGNHQRRLEKTREVPCDAVIADLEDAVAESEKTAARTSVVRWLQQPRGDRFAFVRINALGTPWAFDDLAAVVVRGIDGVVLPKAEGARDLHIADYLISAHERSRELVPGSIEIMPIVETAKGVENMREIARASARVKRMAFGTGDYTNDTGTAWTLDNP